MGKDHIEQFRRIIFENRISPDEMRILSCKDETGCDVEVREADQTLKMRFDNLQVFDNFVRYWKSLQGRPRCEVESKETFSVAPKGRLCRRPLHLVKWEDLGLGLEATPASFDAQHYAFEVQKASSSNIFGPGHQVTLAGHPDIIVPWSDPYLQVEWGAFLAKNGLDREAHVTPNLTTTTYSLHGLTVFKVLRYPEKTVIEHFNPKGSKVWEKTYLHPQKPDIYVTLATKSGSTTHTITVYGRNISVQADFPRRFDDAAKTDFLERLGSALQGIPESLLSPLLDGTTGEKPIKILLASRGIAKDRGITEGNSADGTYDPSGNHIWIKVEPDWSEPPNVGVLFHEVAGHGQDDFLNPDEAGFFSSPKSTQRDYYVWKLRQVFSTEELVLYNELIIRFYELANENGFKPQDFHAREMLEDFRRRAQTRFVSYYAIEGLNGIEEEVRDGPVEDFAEVQKFFLLALNNLIDPRDYCRRTINEPFSRLVGLNYLFHEYGVEKIGDLSRSEVYSRHAFKEVLGIDLQRVEVGSLRSRFTWMALRSPIVGRPLLWFLQ